MSRRPSRLDAWPRPFDPGVELNWGDPVVSRRLLREHLDQSHDGASRRLRTVDEHVRRLQRLLPQPSAHVLDAACGPGLYSVRLAAAGHHVTGHHDRVSADGNIPHAPLLTYRTVTRNRFS